MEGQEVEEDEYVVLLPADPWTGCACAISDLRVADAVSCFSIPIAFEKQQADVTGRLYSLIRDMMAL